MTTNFTYTTSPETSNPVTYTSTAPTNGTSQVITGISNLIEFINSTSITEDSIMNITKQFEMIINSIDPITAQDEAVTNSLIVLASTIINEVVRDQIASALVSLILTFENFINTVTQGLQAMQAPKIIISERIQVYIASVDVGKLESGIITPNRTQISNQLAPTANIPFSVLNEIAIQNNVTSFFTSSITYNLSLAVINETGTTGFISLNFHLPQSSSVSNLVLVQPIDISFPHSFRNIDIVPPLCISFNDTNGINTTGLKLVNFSESSIVCATTHLTTFAAIVSFNRPVERAENLASKMFSFVLLSLSFLALSISLMLFCFAGKGFFCSLPNLIYFNYAIALTLGCGVFIFLLPTAVLNNHYCVIASLVTQYAWIAVFSWSFCIGIVMVQFFREEKIGGQLRCFILYFLFGWGFPVLPCIVTLSAALPDIKNNYVNYESMVRNSTCFLSSDPPVYSTWGMLCPILLLLALNTLALTYLTMKLCWRIKPHKMPFTQSNASRSAFYLQYRTLYLQFLVLISILGLPWFFLVVNVVCNYYIRLNTLTIVMEWLFLLLNGPIGVVFFFVYTIRNTFVKELFSPEPTSTIYTSQQAVSYLTAVREKVTLPSTLPRPRKAPVISSVLLKSEELL